MSAHEDYIKLMVALKTQAPLLSMALTTHTNKREEGMSFIDLPYLPALYASILGEDDVTMMSAVQTGKSELLIIAMLYEAGWLSRHVAYALPTFSVRNRFVQRRIDPLLERIHDYRVRAEYQGGNNLSSKQFGRGSMAFLSSETANDFLEFTCDTFIVDELDACDETNVSKASDRMSAAPSPRIIYIANPQSTKGGIYTKFMLSDQRRWHYRCPHCGHYQHLDWFMHFVRRLDNGTWEPRDLERWRMMPPNAKVPQGTSTAPPKDDLRPICVKCSQPFERRQSCYAWIAESPTASTVGYHMTHLDILYKSMRYTLSEWLKAQGDSQALARFWSSILGIPWVGDSNGLTTPMLQRCATGAPLDFSPRRDAYADEVVLMGVDVGSMLHVTIDVYRRVAEEPSEAEAQAALERAAAKAQRQASSQAKRGGAMGRWRRDNGGGEPGEGEDDADLDDDDGEDEGRGHPTAGLKAKRRSSDGGGSILARLGGGGATRRAAPVVTPAEDEPDIAVDEDGVRYKRVAVVIRTCSEFEDLDRFIEQYNVRTVAIDAMPETRKCQELRDRWEARGDGVEVWLVTFTGTDKVGRERFGMVPKYESNTVAVNRTQLLDTITDEIRSGMRVFPSDVFTVAEWGKQMIASRRSIDPVRNVAKWDEGSQADHFMLSDAYARVALELYQR